MQLFREHKLLQHAGAIAFQSMVAAAPLLLCVLAIFGFLGLSEQWTVEVAPKLVTEVRPDTFSVIDRTVQSVLTEQRGRWLTIGLLLTLWQVGSVIRAAGTSLNVLYGDEEDRPWLARVRNSLGLAALVLPAWVLALVGVFLGGELIAALDAGLLGGALWIARWLAIVAMLLGVVWLVLRVAPAAERPVRYVGLGAGLVVAGWIGGTLAYGVYATEIASYATVFGALAVVVVLITWVWLLAIIFLGGAAVDALVRSRRHTD